MAQKNVPETTKMNQCTVTQLHQSATEGLLNMTAIPNVRQSAAIYNHFCDTEILSTCLK